MNPECCMAWLHADQSKLGKQTMVSLKEQASIDAATGSVRFGYYLFSVIYFFGIARAEGGPRVNQSYYRE
jgi:hypothetical protein